MASARSYLQHLVLSVCLTSTLAGCGSFWDSRKAEPHPVPERFQSLVGTWKTFGTSLSIYQEGYIKYASKNGQMPIEIRGPITKWTDQGFISGAIILTQEFKVTTPPHQVEGKWEMVVNGERLIKTAP